MSTCRRLLCALPLTLLLLPACSHRPPPPVQPALREVKPVASGVLYRFYPAGDKLSPNAPVHVLDIDLSAQGVSLVIAADNPEVNRGAVYANAHNVVDWCSLKEAVAGVNGGFFGQTDGQRKQVIGLLAMDGRILSSGSLYQSPKGPDRKFVRSVLALDGEGMPHIGWMTGERGTAADVKDHDRPLNPTASEPFIATAAVACGPRLIRNGVIQISDAEEKLGSPPAVPRTFVGFNAAGSHPRILVLCVSPTMTYADAAAFLRAYFNEAHSNTPCAEAMCLDGGSSSQMAYRQSEGMISAYPSTVTVPTAILVRSK